MYGIFKGLPQFPGYFLKQYIPMFMAQRIIDLLKSKDVKVDTQEKIAFVYIENDYLEKAVELSQELTGQGKITSIFQVKKNKIGKKLNRLEQEGFTEIIVVDRLEN